MTTQFIENKPILEHSIENGLIFEGDSYCIKHQELHTLGVEFDENGKFINTCPYCEWGDE